MTDPERLKHALACCASGDEGCQECPLRYWEGFECTQHLALLALRFIEELEAKNAAKPVRLIDVDDAIAQIERRKGMMLGDDPSISVGAVVKFLENRPVVNIHLNEGEEQ